MSKKRIAIIGAGASGLPAMKSCLEEDLEPVCFERTNDIGGLWNYSENLGLKNQGSVMKSTVINSSKEIMAYSDYPPLPEYPTFMHHKQVNEYLLSYIEQFNLRKYIRFETEVTKMYQASDFEQSGRWVLELSNGNEQSFDGVMICTGHHTTPYKPNLAGIDHFRGTVIHSQQYREARNFMGKTVLVVGMGESALDISVELGTAGNKVYLSTHHGSWLWNRIARNGVPYDIQYLTRIYQLARDIIPENLLNYYMEHLLTTKVDHELYGFKPKHRFFQQHPTISDHFSNALASGLVHLRGDVKGFEDGNRVLFEDAQKAKIDVIILCTGYSFDFPFLEPQNLIQVEKNEVNLYKYVFPPNMNPPSLAVIGLIQPFGAIMPISEMQTRWVSRVFANKCHLPVTEVMQNEIDKKRTELCERFYASQRHTIEVDSIPYMDELADQIGAKPPLTKLIFSDPELWFSCVVGPNVPYVYRLFGPNSWQDARKTILSTRERLYTPLKGRINQSQSTFMKILDSIFAKRPIHVFFIFASVSLYFLISFGLNLAGVGVTFVISLIFFLTTFFLVAGTNFTDDFTTLF